MLIRWTVTGILTIAPVAALLLWFHRSDTNREPWGKVFRTFLLGVLSVVPAILVALPLLGAGIGSRSPLGFSFFLAFFVAALPEESAKLLVIRGYSARLASFDEPMDGLVYGAAAALGFAAFENILYVADGGISTALLRAVSAVPAHAVTGAMIGYAISSAMFVPCSRARTWKGWFAAVVCHGLYDFGLFAASVSDVSPGVFGPFDGFLLLTIGVVLLEMTWLRRTVRRLRSAQLIASAGGLTTQATSDPSMLSRLHRRDEERIAARHSQPESEEGRMAERRQEAERSGGDR